MFIINQRGDREASFKTAVEAEKRARFWCKRFKRSVKIYTDNYLHVATVLTDALGRTWTEVTHAGGQFL